MSTSTRSRRLSGPAGLIAAGIVGTAALALSLSGTLSALTATITNSTNTASTASLAITETSGSNTCNSWDATATCSSINKYGGTATPLVPGGSQTTTVKFKNAGNIAVASAKLVGGACQATVVPGVQGASTPGTNPTDTSNLCSALTVAVYKGATASGDPVYSGTAAAMAAEHDLKLTLAAGASQDFTFVVSLPAGATSATQGQQVQQQLTWNFNV